MATSDSTETTPRDTREPIAARRLTVMIDPAGGTWPLSSVGLLYSLRSLAYLIGHVDPWHADENELRDALAVTTAFVEMSSTLLLERSDSVPLDIVDKVGALLAEGGVA